MIREEGRREEQAKTQFEKQRADAAEQRADDAEQKMKLLNKIVIVKLQHPEWNSQQIGEVCGCMAEEVEQLLKN